MYFILNFDAKIRVAFAALANPHVVIGGENNPCLQLNPSTNSLARPATSHSHMPVRGSLDNLIKRIGVAGHLKESARVCQYTAPISEKCSLRGSGLNPLPSTRA